MALSLQLGFPSVPKSVTNPNVNIHDALDVAGPMSFLTFLKLINVSFEPDSLQSYYNYYLNIWNTNYNSKDEDSRDIITERYRDFLKELTISYTTLEEKQFLSKIDFNDPYDLDVAMSFYGDKLKELILYYNNKRNNIKFNTIRKKLTGSVFGAEKSIQELTLSYLKNLDDGRMLYDLEKIKEDLEIELDELYNTYPKHYNQTPDNFIYDNKDLDYGYDIFLKDDAQLINEIFSNVSKELKNLKEVDDLFENKRKLTKKYISTDFYYLSTGNTTSDLVSGKLFDADNEILNFLNKKYPTTTSTTRVDYLESKYERGFFRPNKTSIIILDGITKSYKFNVENLSPNSIYYFPDPNIIGENGDIMTFEVDTSYLKRNVSSGNAVNQPYSTPFDTKYNGYVSNITPNKNKYLNSIFESGFIQDSKKDIYGNLFGLFKNDHRFRKNIEVLPEKIYRGMILDGYTFYDELFDENWSFDFTVENVESDPYRSGIYTNTGSFETVKFDLVLNFGMFFKYAEPIYEDMFKLIDNTPMVEGGFLTRYDLILYPDPTSSDLLAYESDGGTFYYSDLIDGGIHTTQPLQRALLSPPRPANFEEFVRGNILNVVEGGHFFQSDITLPGILPYNQYAYDGTVFNHTKLTTLSSHDYVNNPDTYGKIFVKNSSTFETLELLEAMPYLQYRYNTSILKELSNNVVSFDIVNDLIFIKTKNYLIIENIIYDNIFNDPKIKPIYLMESTNPFDKISNTFKHGSSVYYATINTNTPNISSNDFQIYPEIYKFDIINLKTEKLFSKESPSTTSTFFNVSGNNVRYVSSDHPILSYTSRNNIFALTFILKDQNNMPCLQEFDFNLNPNINFTNHNIFKFNNFNNSTIFKTLSGVVVYLSSSSPTLVNESLIL